MKVYAIGFDRFIEQGILPEAEWERIKRDAARQIHGEIIGRAPQADEDPQVGFDYRKDWRTARLPKGKIFGSDYDYWNYVVDDAFRLWNVFAGQVQRDYIADRIAKWGKGGSIPFYTQHPDALQVWQNGVPVGRTLRFDGPQIDVGPTADFSVFLERWNYSKNRRKLRNLVWEVGVMHAIARQLSTDYRGVHTVFVMPIRPKDRSQVREIPNREQSSSGHITTFPIIRILPRHYGRRSGR